MFIDCAVLEVAGAVTLISLGLFQLHNPFWVLRTAFIGANLLRSALTGFYLLAKESQASLCTPRRGVQLNSARRN
jgi:hypothetical protein